MAPTFCCTVPLWCPSPQSTPMRRMGPRKSLVTMNHPSSGRRTSSVDRHTRATPLYKTSSDFELHRIFVSASLPEDHPDALHIPDRKPSLNQDIIRSPSFSRKLHRRLSRKSLVSTKSGMNAIRLGRRSTRQLGHYDKADEHRNPRASANGYDDASAFDSDARSLTLDEYYFATLDPDDAMAVQDTVQTNRRENDTAHCRDPEHLHDSLQHMNSTRHTRSGSSLGEEILRLSDTGPWQITAALTKFDATWQVPLHDWLSPSAPTSLALSTVREQPSRLSECLPMAQSPTGSPCPQKHEMGDPTNPLSLDLTLSEVNALQSSTSIQDQQQRSTSQMTKGSLHLYDMHISQHLRSQSQQSQDDAVDELKKTRDRHPLDDVSLNSILLSSAASHHRRDLSNLSCTNPAMSSIWALSVADASSSIYSSRPSTGEDHHQDPKLILPYELAAPGQNDRNRSLQLEEDSSDQLSALDAIPNASIARRASSTVVDDRTGLEDNQEGLSLTGRGRQQEVHLAKSSSSGSIGKLSRFKEDLAFALPTGSKKRRSVFQVLFPKLVKPRLRSISTPLLRQRLTLATGTFDGASDGHCMLEIPGPVAANQIAARSFSLNEAGSQAPSDIRSSRYESTSNSGSATASLADYEINLTISGDDRRRRSAVDVETVRMAEAETLGEPAGRPLRRAKPLSGENSLMEKALHQHRLEKAALFRGNSKRSNAPGAFDQAPVFSVPFVTSTASRPGHTTVGCDDVDPLEIASTSSIRRSQSSQQLCPQPDPYSTPETSKTFDTKRTASTSSLVSRRGRRRSAATLNAWSRFPSHTRAERCGSAGREDNILTQDFAYATASGREPSSAMFDTPSSSMHINSAYVKKKRHNWIVKSRSMTFGSVMRYYHNLLTSSAGRNRRSSVTTGGRLEHPELEILPPTLPAHPLGTLRPEHPPGHLAHFIDHIRQEGHHLRAEVREEKHQLKVEVAEEGHRMMDESHDVLAHHPHIGHRRRLSDADIDPHDTGDDDIAPQDSSDSENEKEVSILDGDMNERAYKTLAPLDGTAEGTCEDLNRSGIAPSARRLSRMYQHYVQLPTSLDVLAGAECETVNGATPEGCSVDVEQQQVRDVSGVKSSEGSAMLSVPTLEHRSHRDGSVVRRFPSVTVVDDRKGHWRSISLISTQSGKSLRTSTNDLLDLIREAESHERKKLMKAAEDVGLEVKPSA